MDWARDTFRTSIIAQLAALATGKDFDEISLGPDSDIISKPSKNTTIQDWISRVPSTLVHDDDYHRSGSKPTHWEDRNDSLSKELPNTQFGAVRSVSTTIFELAGLRLTEGNVESLLALSDEPYILDQFLPRVKYSQCARKVLNEITRWDEVLVVLGADLDHIERVWTDEGRMTPEPFDEGPGTEFYVIFEYRCYVNISWEVTRELSYLAVSKSAFTILVKPAAFQRKHPGIEHFPKTSRLCSSALLQDAIDCLRSGSTWQVLHSAISSTLLSLCPEPEKIREDFSPVVTCLAFGYHRSVRVRHFVENYMKIVQRSAPKPRRNVESCRQDFKRIKRHIDAWEEKTCNRSFWRMSKRALRGQEAFHDPSNCTRCRSSNQDLFAMKSWDRDSMPSASAYGAILVAALKEEPCPKYSSSPEHQQRHDVSLFILENPSWLEDDVSVATVVQDLAQNTMIYHTILHEPLMKDGDGSGAVIWNLPCPYRKSTRRQRWDIARWFEELHGPQAPDSSFLTQSMPPWVHQQMLLHFLKSNMPYDDALAALMEYRDRAKKKLAKNGGEKYAYGETTPKPDDLPGFWNKVSPFKPRPSDQSPWSPEKLRVRE